MYGLAAIQQANGWAMAGAGACHCAYRPGGAFFSYFH
jgi:hypothetical protein